jgi:hypothetical protein
MHNGEQFFGDLRGLWCAPSNEPKNKVRAPLRARPIPTDQPSEVRHTGGIIFSNRKTLAFELSLADELGLVVGVLTVPCPQSSKT